MSLRPPSFSKLWCRFFDETVPQWVKATYSKKKSIKTEFTESDARFFARGILELSENLTLDRGDTLRRPKTSYFAHPRFRSSYLLYFFPLQAAKFFTLFDIRRNVLLDVLKTNEIHIADFGAGPGTASLSFLIWALDQKGDLPKKIVMHWIDTDFHILKDGEQLLNLLCEQMPELKGRIALKKITAPWHAYKMEESAKPDLAFFGNVLNEKSGLSDHEISYLENLLDTLGPAGALFLEPADRNSSQLLSLLRDQLLEKGTKVVWPCLHQKRCPLSHGRDWCHFSTRVQVPGGWFKFFSKALGSERHRLKYSGLWLVGKKHGSQIRESQKQWRVISDTILTQNKETFILLCEPEKPFRLKVSQGTRLYRGDIYRR